MARQAAMRLLGACVLLGALATLGPARSIDAAKVQPDGTAVTLQGKVATVGKSDFSKVLPQFVAGVSQGAVQSNDVTEASGIAASRKNANVLWVHNDSGDSARVFAMTTTGTHLGIYNLSGMTARDCEDIAIGPGPTPGESYLYIGDIGDNNAAYSTVFVYRVAEPAVSSTQQPVNVNLSGVQKFTLSYEDGPRDAETLMVDPTNGDLYVLSKRVSQSKVYRVPAASLVPGTTITMHAVAQLPWGWTTGGDISPNGNEVIIRGYGQASLWRRPPGGNLWDAFSGTEHPIALRSEPQGEAICFEGNGRGCFTTSEGAHQPIYYYSRVPDAANAFLYIEEPSGAYLTLDEGSAPVRVDTSLLCLAVVAGDLIGVCGLSSLLRSGSTRLRLLIPRADADVTVIRP